MLRLLPLLLASSHAFAADVPPPGEPVLASIGPALMNLLVAAAIAGLGALSNFLLKLSAESKAARVGKVLSDAASAAVLEVDVTLRPQLASALADGKITKEEGEALKRAAMDLVKSKLPGGLLATAAKIFGALTETVISGKIEQALAEKKLVEAKTESLRASPQ